jgi:protein-L-isoaspartate(D-aspartate) O-methyltransferase
MDYESARKSMVRGQLVARGITDPGVLAAMGKIPRERFVKGSLKNQAYSDSPLPIGEGQTISQPYIVAYMTEALDLTGSEKTLEIGTGSGYQAAILAELSRTVYTVERIATHLETAKKILAELGYTNIQFKLHNGTLGWEEAAPYDAIIVTAAAPRIPQPLYEQMADGGRLVIPVGDRTGQELIKVTKEETGFRESFLGGVRFVSLVGEHGWKE